MKVITASTPEQQNYVSDLIEKLYENIFPYFFSNDYIRELKDFKLMQVPNLEDLSLTEIMEVTAAIQTITTILDQLAKSNQKLDEYSEAFNKNAVILSKYHIDFPFKLVDFHMVQTGEISSNKNSLYI